MFDKNQQRLRRARQTRAKIAELAVARLAVHRSNNHIYAQVIDASGSKIVAAASTSDGFTARQASAASAGQGASRRATAKVSASPPAERRMLTATITSSRSPTSAPTTARSAG